MKVLKNRSTPLSIWLADLTYTQQQVASDVMPAAIGCIAAFAQRHIRPKPKFRLFKYPEKMLEALRKGAPDLVGFSNYVWNFQLSYGFASLIRRMAPETTLVFGGPNYPVESEEQADFLRAHPAIDFYVVKEGEVAFAELLKALHQTGGDREGTKVMALPGIHAVTREGRFIGPPTAERIRDLSEIPSPYLNGMLDEFFDGRLVPILHTNRGCPFSCTFCVEGVSYYGKVYKTGREKVAQEVDYIGRRMAVCRQAGGRNDLRIADSNFGMYLDDLETCRQLDASRTKHGWPEYILASTGKNHKVRVLEAARIIQGALQLSGSVQSLDPEVLSNVKRSNINASQLIELALQADVIGANSYSEIILGLPGDSRERHLRTLETAIAAGFKNVYPFQLMMLPGTELNSEKTRAQYGMQTRFRVLPRCFGHFSIDQDEVTCAEVEEICVALNTLSFDDYLSCRQFHLMIACFYNDGLFKGLLKLLRVLEVSRFAWLESILQACHESKLSDFLGAFVTETREELWESKNALLDFTRRPENVERYVRGELGANLLFKYKGLALTHHLELLAERARSAAETLIRRTGRWSPGMEGLMDDVLAYDLNRKVGLFSGDYRPRQVDLRFDVPRFLSDEPVRDLDEYALPKARRVRFFHDEKQVDILERHLQLYGRGDLGVIRILTKVYLERLYRHAEVEAGSPPPRATQDQNYRRPISDMPSWPIVSPRPLP